MRDTELYRHLLGIDQPWEVDRVELSVTEERVDVWVVHAKRTRFACPECAELLPVYDHSEQRSWPGPSQSRWGSAVSWGDSRVLALGSDGW